MADLMSLTFEDKVRRLTHTAAHLFSIRNFRDIFIVDVMENKESCYGWYDIGTGYIEVRIKRLRGDGFLALSTIIDTIAHELAHAVYFPHDKNHRHLTIAIREWLNRNWDNPVYLL